MRIIIELEGLNGTPTVIVQDNNNNNNKPITIGATGGAAATEAPPEELLLAAARLGAASAGKARIAPERLVPLPAAEVAEAVAMSAGQAPMGARSADAEPPPRRTSRRKARG